MAAFKDHFSSHAAGYAKHRPTYPAALVEFLASVAPSRRLAWDCGCGTGQLSVLLASRFDRVVATDASLQQIENATRAPHVEYRCAAAEHSGFQACSVDLIVAAQAAHWFDLPAFYAEVSCVGRAKAAVALVAYGVLKLPDDAEIDRLVSRFYYGVLGPHWPPERRHVENGYRTLPFPFPEIASPELAIEVSWDLLDLLGYVETWSAVRALERANGRATFEDFRRNLARAWGSERSRRLVQWPLSLRVGHVDGGAA